MNAIILRWRRLEQNGNIAAMPEQNGPPSDPAYLWMPLSYFMIRQVFRFHVHCRKCRRHAHVYLTTLMNKYDSEDSLRDVNLRCTKCRNRDCSIHPDIDYKPDGKLIRFPVKKLAVKVR